MRKYVVLAFLLLIATLSGLSSATADTPVLTKTLLFSEPGIMPVINLTNHATCAFVYVSNGGTAIVTAYGSGDGGTTYYPVPGLAQVNTAGTYGAGIVPYVTNFRVYVDVVSGTVTVTETCSGAVPPPGTPGPTPTPVPTTSPTPTPTPIPTPPTPTPSPTPSTLPTAVASLNPLLYYRLDETPAPGSSAAVVDSSGNGYNGIPYNPANIMRGQAGICGTSCGTSYQMLYPGYIGIPSNFPQSATYSIIGMLKATGPTWPPFCLVDYFGGCLFVTSNGYMGWSADPPPRTGTTAYQLDTVRGHFACLAVDNTAASSTTVHLSVDGSTFVNATVGKQFAGHYSYVADNYYVDSTPVLIDEIGLFPYELTQTQCQQLATAGGFPQPSPTPSPTPTPPGNYQSLVTSYSPFVYYKLDETMGSTAVDSVAGRNSTIFGSPTLGATGLCSSCNTAYTFTNNSTQYVTGASLPFYHTYSIIVLVNFTSVPTGWASLGGYHTTNGYGLENGVPGSYNAHNAIYTSGPALTANVTHLIVYECFYGTDNCSVSQDGGTLVTFGPGTGPSDSASNNFYINRSDVYFQGFSNATIDEYAMFAYPLSQTQINTLFSVIGK